MHKILTIVVSALLLSLSLRAQTHIQQVDSSLRFLDKSRIQTDALYDRVMPWADLINYSSTDIVDYKFVRQAWHELYLSKYDRSNLKDAAALDHL